MPGLLTSALCRPDVGGIFPCDSIRFARTRKAAHVFFRAPESNAWQWSFHLTQPSAGLLPKSVARTRLICVVVPLQRLHGFNDCPGNRCRQSATRFAHFSTAGARCAPTNLHKNMDADFHQSQHVNYLIRCYEAKPLKTP